MGIVGKGKETIRRWGLGVGILMMPLCNLHADLLRVSVLDVHGKLWQDVHVQVVEASRELVMTITEGAGEVRIVWSWDRISRVYPSVIDPDHANHGDPQERTQGDLQQLRQIYAGWLPLIPLLQEDQLPPLLVWLRQEALLGDPEQALHLARILEQRLQSPILLTEVQQHILRLLRELAPQEARDYAEPWVAAKPWYQGRLLGYWVLAEWELQNGHVERALWVALEAIVGGGPVSDRWFGHCYAIAITAAWQLREQELAERLWVEMKERRIAWPESLAETYQDAWRWAQSSAEREQQVEEAQLVRSQPAPRDAADAPQDIGKESPAKPWQDILRTLRSDRELETK